MNYKYRFGMRAFKTVLAVFVTMFVCLLFNRTDYTFALIAACITIGTTVVDSFEDAYNRILGTIFGALVGLIYFILNLNFQYNKFVEPFILSIHIFLIIYLCNVFNIGKIISMSCVVFFSISLNQNIQNNIQNPVSYTVNRVIDTSIGIIVAILINIFIFPPDNLKEIKKKSDKLFLKFNDFMCKLRNNNKFIKEDFDELEEIYDNIMKNIIIEKNEIKINKKNDINKLNIYKKNYLYRDLLESLRDIYKINEEIEFIKYLKSEETKFVGEEKSELNFKTQIENLEIVLDYHKKRAEYDYVIIENFQNKKSEL